MVIDKEKKDKTATDVTDMKSWTTATSTCEYHRKHIKAAKYCVKIISAKHDPINISIKVKENSEKPVTSGIDTKSSIGKKFTKKHHSKHRKVVNTNNSNI